MGWHPKEQEVFRVGRTAGEMKTNIPRPTGVGDATRSARKGDMKTKGPPRSESRGARRPGNDLLSPSTDYHRPWMLNGRVRNGNGCIHPGMLTGSLVPRMPGACINKAAAEWRLIFTKSETEGRINAAKRSAVSTGQLSALLHLHTRPIDLVVFQEPSYLRTGDLVSRGVSRLDAFSVYPGRT
jgi:hypothetical protein